MIISHLTRQEANNQDILLRAGDKACRFIFDKYTLLIEWVSLSYSFHYPPTMEGGDKDELSVDKMFSY